MAIDLYISHTSSMAMRIVTLLLNDCLPCPHNYTTRLTCAQLVPLQQWARGDVLSSMTTMLLQVIRNIEMHPLHVQTTRRSLSGGSDGAYEYDGRGNDDTHTKTLLDVHAQPSASPTRTFTFHQLPRGADGWASRTRDDSSCKTTVNHRRPLASRHTSPTA